MLKGASQFCSVISNAQSSEPAVKKPKLASDADISGGLPNLLKQKVTEVSSWLVK